jgi:hypothetical protein
MSLLSIKSAIKKKKTEPVKEPVEMTLELALTCPLEDLYKYLKTKGSEFTIHVNHNIPGSLKKKPLNLHNKKTLKEYFDTDMLISKLQLHHLTTFNGTLNFHFATDGWDDDLFLSAESFPSCCGAVILHNIDICHQDDFLNIFGFRFVEKLMVEYCNYTSLIACHLEEEINCFKLLKYKEIDSFINTRTRNLVTYFIKNFDKSE